MHVYRLRVVPYFSSGMVEGAKRECAWKSPRRVSPFLACRNVLFNTSRWISNKQTESFHFKKPTNRLSMAAFRYVSSTDALIYVDVISNKQSIFSSQIRTPSFSINWPSLVSTARSPIILWRLWSHKPSHKHDSNKYQSKAFVICDHKSDETRSVTHVNKVYLVWLMFRVLSN